MGATLSVLLGHLIAVARLLRSRGSRAQLWCVGLVAPWPVGPFQTRDRTRVPCIGRQILCHWATGEVPKLCLKSSPPVMYGGRNLIRNVEAPGAGGEGWNGPTGHHIQDRSLGSRLLLLSRSCSATALITLYGLISGTLDSERCH